jgi:hypothetical protein
MGVVGAARDGMIGGKRDDAIGGGRDGAVGGERDGIIGGACGIGRWAGHYRGDGVSGGCSRRGRSFLAGMGIISGFRKLSLYDSSHLTAEAPAGKLEPGLLNFNTHKDCSWHVR